MAKTKDDGVKAGASRKGAPSTSPALHEATARDAAMSDESHPGVVDRVGESVNASVRVVRGVLPAHRLPVYLAGAALLVTGILDAPALLGAGLAYEALRRWEPASTR